MAIPVTITYANPAEGTCPPTIDALVELLRQITTGAVPGSYIPYVMGFNTPAVEDQDKAWIRLDASGRPLGTFVFYAGSWRRQYTGKPSEMAYFNGDPASYFDGTGKGLTTAEWDGWAICNGNNGTPNLTDRFIVGAHMDNSAGQTGYSSGVWRTFVDGVIHGTGGSVYQNINDTLIPRPAKDAVLVDTFAADGNARSNTGKLYGEHSVATGSGGVVTLVPADPGNPETTIGFVPPFYAMAICMFIGYS